MNPEKITILDAGMGKTLAMKGIEIPPTIWSANALLVAPGSVCEVHRENIAAGAKVITTNSYGVIRSDLAKEGIEDRYQELNELAGELAKSAVDESGVEVAIAGSLPPQNGSYRPDLVLDRKVLEPIYTEQAEMLAPYVDFFLCETMSSISEALAAASAALSVGKPVFVSLTLHDERQRCLRSSEPVVEALSQLNSLKLAGILFNCCLPERISDAMSLLNSAAVDYRGGYANAFTHVPQDWLLDGNKQRDGRLTLREDISPQKYSDFVDDWLAKGANMVGGCCGTTAAHTQAIAERLCLTENS
jgi:S-methylmethionine-dependent homocysteine/selenocysteine methylase